MNGGNQLKLCPYFLRGRCSFGDTCKLSHSKSSAPAGVGSNPRSRSNLKKAKGKSPSDAASVVYHDGLGNDEGSAQKAPNSCIFYQLGGCNNGDQCKFPHEDPESSSSKESTGAGCFFVFVTNNYFGRSQKLVF